MGNWLSSLFSSPNNSKNNKDHQITAYDRAILDLKIQRDKLKQFSKKLESVLAREKEVARQLLREGKQNLARLCLRKKRFQEQLLERLSVHLANLEQLVDTLEFSIIEKKVFDGLKEGNEVLKKIQQEMSVEAVEELLLDTQNAIQHQKEIDAMLSEQLTMEDEEEIQKELETLDQEITELTEPHSSLDSLSPTSKKIESSSSVSESLSALKTKSSPQSPLTTTNSTLVDNISSNGEVLSNEDKKLEKDWTQLPSHSDHSLQNNQKSVPMVKNTDLQEKSPPKREAQLMPAT